MYMNLKYWITGFVAIAATAYMLNNFSYEKLPNGIEIIGSNSKTQIVNDRKKNELKFEHNNSKKSLETTLKSENGTYLGTYSSPRKRIRFDLNNYLKEGNIDGYFKDKFIGNIKIKKKDSNTSILDSLIQGFDYLYDKNGVVSGASYIRF